jgi:hypothetical protein
MLIKRGADNDLIKTYGISDSEMNMDESLRGLMNLVVS